MKRPVLHKIRRAPLDRLFFWIVTFGWNKAALGDYPKHLGRHTDTLPRGMSHVFQQIDGKATGLLAHVSLMIAGLGLVAPLVVDNELEKGVVIGEIAFYLLIAVGCLRCLAVFPFHEVSDTGSGARDRAFHELILRRELYGLCNRVAIWLTIAVFAILPFLYFYKPEN